MNRRGFFGRLLGRVAATCVAKPVVPVPAKVPPPTLAYTIAPSPKQLLCLSGLMNKGIITVDESRSLHEGAEFWTARLSGDSA